MTEYVNTLFRLPVGERQESKQITGRPYKRPNTSQKHHSKRKRGKQTRLEGNRQLVSSFQSPTVLTWCVSSSHTDWPNTYEAVVYSHLCNPHSSQTVLCQKSPSGPWICTRTTCMCPVSRGMTIFWSFYCPKSLAFIIARKKGAEGKGGGT